MNRIAENLKEQCRSDDPRMALAAMRTIEEARDWLRDCVWEDMDDEGFITLGTDEIVQGVERHYVGGWEAFLRAIPDEGPEPYLA